MVVQRVFHPTDFSAGANAALRLALEVVDRFGAELLVGHVAPGVGADSSKANELERRLKDLVEGVRRELSIDGKGSLRVSHHVIDQGSFAGGIVEFADEQAVDLIAIGRYGGRPVRRLLMGSVALDVLHKAKADVLIVPDVPDSSAGGGRVLVPVDLRDRSVSLVASAAEIARAFGAAIELMHVIDLPERLQLSPDVLESVGVGSLADVADERLASVAADSRTTVPVTTRVETGHPAGTILKVLNEERYRLLVLASSGMGPDERVRNYPMEVERYDELQWIVSRVTERLAAYAPVPVWVVKRFPAEAPQPAPARSVQDPTVLDI